MEINLAEINRLNDKELAATVLNAELQKRSATEQESLYQQLFYYYQNNQLLVHPTFFIPYSENLYRERKSMPLMVLAATLKNINSICEKNILLSFETGKIAQGSNRGLSYLRELMDAGLVSKALMFCSHIEKFISSKFNFKIMKIKLLILISDENLLLEELSSLRKEYLKIASKQNSEQISQWNEITQILENYSYKSKYFFLEKSRWMVLNYIFQDIPAIHGIDQKNFIDFFVITDDINDYIYLSVLYEKVESELGTYLNLFTRKHADFRLQQISKNSPFFFKYFKESVGVISRTDKPQRSINKTNKIKKEKIEIEDLQNKLYAVSTDHISPEEREQIISQFKRYVEPGQKQKISFTDILFIIRDINLLDLLEDIFWIGHEKGVLQSSDYYLVGKTLFDHNEYSKAFSVLILSDQEDSKSLFKEVCLAKEKAGNA